MTHSPFSHLFSTLDIAPVMPQLQTPEKVCLLDFSPHNSELLAIDVADTVVFSQYVEKVLADKKALAGVGGYMEWREIYRRSRLFDGEGEDRCIHLGVDIWAPGLTPVHTPLAGKVHSMKDNEGYGNYGGTIIMEHQIENTTLYTLYGHLSLASVEGVGVGQEFEKGEVIGALGIEEENGHWPPHLHFQLMFDMLGNWGDFPGVCTRSEQPKYEAICPNPNWLLRLPVLG